MEFLPINQYDQVLDKNALAVAYCEMVNPVQTACRISALCRCAQIIVVEFRVGQE